MTDDPNRVELRVSRSGRILKKTLKIKEMEDLEIKEDRQEKCHRRLVHHPMHRKLEVKQSASRVFAHDTTESSSSGSLTLSSSEDDSSEDDSISNTSFDKSSEEFDDPPKQQEFRMIPKRVCEKVQDYSTVKRKRKRKPFTIPKICSTQIKTVKGTSDASRKNFNSYSQRETERIEDINKKLILSELSKRLRGTCLPLPRKEKEVFQRRAKQPSLLQSGNSSDTKCNEKHVNSQKHEQPMELIDSSLTLGIAPVDVAAHLKLLGDSLTKIGTTVANLNHIGPGVYSSLLDVLLCSMGPLLCLTREIPGLESLPEDVFMKILDHIAYIIPGL